jgi:hypothetical protein
VKVGIAYEVGQEKAASALGADGATAPASQRGQAEAFVRWVNDNGGLAGHKIEPVWAPKEFTDSRSNAERASAVCAQWTQDNKVVAGIVLGPFPNDLARCLNNAGALYLQWGWTLHEQSEYRQIPNMWNPGELGVEQLVQVYADGLVANGFFGPGAKVGLLVNEYPAAQAGRRMLKARLASHGVALDDANVYTVPQPSGWTAVTSSLQALQNAQLKMRAGGVTHVLSLCWGCAAFFMTYASDQKWTPKYGLTSADLPSGIVGDPPNPKTVGQLRGAVGIGWWPVDDIKTLGNPSAPVNATWNRCQDIIRPTGLGTKQQIDQQYSSAFCGALLFLKAAAEASQAYPITGTALRQGAERLGTTYQDPMSLHTNLGPNRHSGVDRVRPFRFVDSCTCFEYFGAEIQLP